MKVMVRKILMVISVSIFLCCNTFSAIVSDNDGSAFVTKREFETLKNDFDEQVNNYNNSIDRKIDGAIASYLAGINLSKTVTLESLYNKTLERDANSNRWIDISGINPTTSDGKHIKTGFFQTIRFGIADTTFGSGCYSYIISNFNSGLANINYVADPQKSTCFFANKYEVGSNNYWYLQDTKIHTAELVLTVSSTLGVGAASTVWYDQNKPPSSYTFNFSAATEPSVLDNIWTHTWASVGSWTPQSESSGSISTNWTDGTNYPNLAYNASGAVATDEFYLTEYNERFTYDNSSGNLKTKNVYNTASTANPGWHMFSDYSGDIGARSEKVTTFNWIYPYQKFVKIKFSDLINYYASYTANDIVYKYSGIPLFNVTEKGKVKLKLKGTTSTGKYTLVIADSKFSNSSSLSLVNANGKIVYQKTGLTSNVDQTIEFDVDRLLNKDGDVYYVKVKPETTSAYVTLAQIGDITITLE